MPGIFENTENQRLENKTGDNNVSADIAETAGEGDGGPQDMEGIVQERSQTDVLNKHLLKFLLEKMNCGEITTNLSNSHNENENR
ncbi:hypothetical protein DMENIID0001_121380 [Sergentomyia squamirostris]